MYLCCQGISRHKWFSTGVKCSTRLVSPLRRRVVIRTEDVWYFMELSCLIYWYHFIIVIFVLSATFKWSRNYTRLIIMIMRSGSRYHATHHPTSAHDDVIKWNHFPRYWLFVRGIHRVRWIPRTKGHWRGALMFSLICAWINDWVNNREAGDLRRHRGHNDVNVMPVTYICRSNVYGNTGNVYANGKWRQRSRRDQSAMAFTGNRNTTQTHRRPVLCIDFLSLVERHPGSLII